MSLKDKVFQLVVNEPRVRPTHLLLKFPEYSFEEVQEAVSDLLEDATYSKPGLILTSDLRLVAVDV